MTPPRRLVLDTDVLFSRVYHETYGRLGAEGVVIVIWSEEILAELERVLIEHDRSPRHARAVCSFVRAGFPDSQVDPKSEDGAGFVSDPADAHVAAAAVAGRAEAIVTRNRLDYRAAELLELGIAVIDPIDHPTAAADAYPTETRSAIIRQAAASTPSRTPVELLDLFRDRGHERLAESLGRSLASPESAGGESPADRLGTPRQPLSPPFTSDRRALRPSNGARHQPFSLSVQVLIRRRPRMRGLETLLQGL